MFKNEIHSETTIEGTADEVWGVLSDFASYPHWNPGMEQVQGEAKVGTRLRIRFRLNGGRVMTMKPTVLVAEPGRELRWLGRLLLPSRMFGLVSPDITTIDMPPDAAPDATPGAGRAIGFSRGLLVRDPDGHAVRVVTP